MSIPDCRCGHARNAHPDEYEEACAVPNCTCPEFIPGDLSALELSTPVVVHSAPMTQDEADDNEAALRALVAAGKRSHVKRTVSLAERVESLVADLRDRLADERETAKARAEVERLEKQLAAARAKAGIASPVKRRHGSTGTCPDCGQDGLANVGVHRYHKHGVKKGAA